MRRARSKKLAIMILFTFMATLFAAVPMASASASYSVVSGASKVTAGKSQDLGAVKVLFHMAELNKDSYLTLRLPTDFDFNMPEEKVDFSVAGKVYQEGDTFYLIDDNEQANKYGISLTIPVLKNALALDVNGTKSYASKAFEFESLADNEIKITIKKNETTGFANEKEGYFFVNLKNVYVDSGYNDDIDVVIDGQQGTVFSSGKLIVGTAGAGNVDISIDSVKTITTSDNQQDIDTIRFEEDRAGAWEKADY